MMFYKIKRETLRLLKNAARDLPFCFSGGVRTGIFSMWNRWQHDEEAMGKQHLCYGSLAPLRDGLTLLNLDFLNGFGETVHPDVLFVPNGWCRKEWRYLMTLTPMPCGTEYFENPEFVVSADGVNWRLPEGGASPIVPAPDDWLGFNSDPSLFLEGDTLYIFYRDIREYSLGNIVARILMMNTQDGVRWTRPVELLTCRHARKYPAVLMSPTIIKIDGMFYMWFISVEDKKYYIFRLVSKDLASWSQPEKTLVYGLGDSELPWHLDVVRDGEDLVMALCISDREHFRRKSLCFASSGDRGITWNVRNTRLRPGYLGFGERSLYRGSIVKDDSGKEWKLYYSGQDKDEHWRTVLTKIMI